MQIHHDHVLEIIRDAAETHILPLWQNLEHHQVMDKGGGDLVTAADRACEHFLTDRLGKLLERSLVVGEEAVAADASTLDALQSDRPVWVIDPLDGTRNFAHHREPFAVMVCLLVRGETIASWIYDPLSQSLLSAERGAGTMLDGARITIESAPRPAADMRGAVMTSYLPGSLRGYVEDRREAFADWTGFGCAAYEYRRLVTGEVDFLLYYRTLVWDHAPGVLVVEEAGGVSRRYGGESYVPTDSLNGLICANGEDNWKTVREVLLPEEIPA